MLIGIEAERANFAQKTGVEHYAKQLILHLAKIDSENNYILYLRTKPQEWLLHLPKNFKIKLIPFPIFWTQVRLSWELFFYPVDTFLILASAIPFYHPKNSVVTIHDLAWKLYPKTYTKFTKWFLNWSTGFAVKHAKKIIAVSESTKKDLVKYFGVLKSKVWVVHHGFENQVLDVRYQVSAELQKQLPEKYVLFLSTLQPRKNLEGLIDAFVLLKKELPELPHKLVVVGKAGWKFESILKKIQDNQENVVYLNYVSDQDRQYILKSATAMVLPSFYEGFGMTVLEAFFAKVPVLCANNSSMPEIAKDAALYFNSHNVLDIKTALKNIVLDKSLQETLVLKGENRLKNFSWEKCARETLAVLVN